MVWARLEIQLRNRVMALFFSLFLLTHTEKETLSFTAKIAKCGKKRVLSVSN